MANHDAPRLEGARPAAASAPFVFYSALYRRLVVDVSGRPVGRLDDLAVTLGETYPPAAALLIRRGWVESFRLTARWRDVESIDGPAIRLRVPVEGLVPGRFAPSDHTYWVGEVLLDRQIVDTAGAKVVRVNDLHFLWTASGDLYLVHVDVGFRGLVRRLGWNAAIDAAVRRVAPHARYLSSERLIGWRYVQPLTLAGTGDALQLSVTRRELGKLHPAELADILTELDGRERESVFRALEPEAAAEALTEVEPRIRQRLIASVPAERAADILEEMPPDEAADLLAALPEPQSNLLLEKMERQEAEDVQELLRYEPDTAGGMMTTELIALGAELTAAEALARLRSLAGEVELIYYLYVVDGAGRLQGVITIRHLLLADPGARLETIMQRDPVRVLPDDTRERVAEVVEKYNLLAVPVADAEGRLLGIVTVDDVLTHMTALAWKWKLGRRR
jgi:CBS domain-containing protein/sporulation protein YlmC with PRC-barrel domain